MKLKIACIAGDGIGPEIVDKSEGRHCGVDFADTRLGHGDGRRRYAPGAKLESVDGGLLHLFHLVQKHRQLRLHGHDYTVNHIFVIVDFFSCRSPAANIRQIFVCPTSLPAANLRFFRRSLPILKKIAHFSRTSRRRRLFYLYKFTPFHYVY